MMPNLRPIVQAVRDRGGWDFTTTAGLCAYTNAVVVALHVADADFGHLRKTEGQTHCVDPSGRLTAADVALYKPTGQIVDFIESAGYGTPAPPNHVAWTEGPVGEYSADDWLEPVAGTPPVPAPAPDGDDPNLKRLETLLDEILSQIGLQNRLQAKQDERVQALESRADKIAARVQALEDRPTGTPPPVTPPIAIPKPKWWPW